MMHRHWCMQKLVQSQAPWLQRLLHVKDIVLRQDKMEKIARANTISKRAFRWIKEIIFVGVKVVHVISIALVLMRIPGPLHAAAIPYFLIL